MSDWGIIITSVITALLLAYILGEIIVRSRRRR